jgi:hypothetical protein
VALLILAFPAANGSAQGITYYVANDGDDFASGTSTDHPWQTLARVTVATFLPGDSILLKRGDEWYEQLTIPSSGTAADPITFGAYGTGSMPRILGSVELTEWAHVTGNIWVSVEETDDPSRGAPHDGSQQGSGGWPGGAWFEELDGSITWGHQEKVIDVPGDFSEFSEEYDWGWFGNHVYVWSTVDPGAAYAGMHPSQRQHAIGMENNNPAEHIVVDGIEMLFTQSNGFSGGYPAREARDLTIRNCHVGYIGIKGAASASGLAVWHSDLVIADNEIHDCGRRSVSYNVDATRNVTFSNVTIEGNHFHHGFHTAGIDIANPGTDTFRGFTIRGNLFEGDPTVDLAAAPEAFNSNHVWTRNESGGVLADFDISNNLFTDCHGTGLAITGIADARISFNTFFGVNPTLADYQAQLYFSGGVTGAVVRNNIFFNDVDPSFNPSFMCVKADLAHLPEIDMDSNLFYTTDENAFIVDIVGISGSYTAAEWQRYKAETGWDASSPVPEDPNFISPPDDLHLSAGSPAVEHGVVVPGIVVDLDGYPRSVPPSLGAHTFLVFPSIFSDDFESGGWGAWAVVGP